MCSPRKMELLLLLLLLFITITTIIISMLLLAVAITLPTESSLLGSERQQMPVVRFLCSLKAARGM